MCIHFYYLIAKAIHGEVKKKKTQKIKRNKKEGTENHL